MFLAPLNDSQSPRTPIDNAPFQPKLESSRIRKRGQYRACGIDTERARGFMYVFPLLRLSPSFSLDYNDTNGCRLTSVWLCSLADGVDRDHGYLCGVVRDHAAVVYCWGAVNGARTEMRTVIWIAVCSSSFYFLFGFMEDGRRLYHRLVKYYNIHPSS